MERVALVSKDERQEKIPRDERQVSVGVLVTNKVFGTLSFKMLIQDRKHTLDLVTISFNCRFNLCFMMDTKPDTLAEVRALTRYLEVEPRFIISYSFSATDMSLYSLTTACTGICQE